MPARRYGYGTDWKANLLAKANALNFYDRLIEHDNNAPLPFANESMRYVYSNSSYWVDKFEDHLRDMARVAAPGGKIVLEMKTSEIRKFVSSKYLPQMGNTFHQIIDAGRLETWKGLRGKQEIIDILGEIPEVAIVSTKPVYGDVMAIIWDIGLRPLFRPLARMAGALIDEQRVSIKEEWCHIFEDLFAELLMNYVAEEDSAIEHCFVLEKL